MEPILTPIEARVLGALVEKQITTPEYYPLTLNSLTAACNQKNNRDPVMELSERRVEDALDELRMKGLVWHVETPGSRVPKYEHRIPERWHLERREIVVMCELMLRGPQTVGELRAHTKRMVEFPGTADVEKVLDDLSRRSDIAFVLRLDRRSGQKDVRYAQVLTGVPEPDPDTARPRVVRLENDRGLVESAVCGPDDRHRIALLEERVRVLEEELERMRSTIEELRG